MRLGHSGTTPLVESRLPVGSYSTGRPFSGMLDFLSDDQMYNISYEDLICNQNEKVIAQLMEVYNSSQPIEYYVAEIKAYHERNLKLISKLNDEIVLALEILTNR